MKTFKEYKEKQMKNPEFLEEYNAIQPDLEITRAIIDARNSSNLTQKQLSVLTGIDQADISKIENGVRNPSISLLQKLASGMGMTLKIEFVPKEKN